mgnify:CR=1 FL=1
MRAALVTPVRLKRDFEGNSIQKILDKINDAPAPVVTIAGLAELKEGLSQRSGPTEYEMKRDQQERKMQLNLRLDQLKDRTKDREPDEDEAAEMEDIRLDLKDLMKTLRQ